MSTRGKQDITEENTGEILLVWKNYKASSSDELSLQEGDLVELIDTSDPAGPASKRIKLDPELDVQAEKLLDSSAARHKLSVKPRRTHTSSRHSPSRTSLNARWLVKKLKGDKSQGWVPCHILQSADEPVPGTGLPGDAAFRRQAVVSELVETEQEFVKDIDFVVQNYLLRSEKDPKKMPKVLKDNFEIIFGNLKEIAEFHRTVLMEGVKYYANEPHLLGKAFLRLERDFDKHVSYCKEEPLAQAFLDSSAQARDYFEELSQRLGDDKSLAEHLKLPIQRINDYQLLLKELVRYSACLGEDNSNLQKALELMLSVPHRAQDDKFTSSIEGYRGSIHKLGRLLAHDWFSVNFGEQTKERYLFLFKARILICKVRRISEDRSVFQLKDIIRLPQVDVKDHPENNRAFELIEKVTGQSLILTAHRDSIKEFWLKEVREFSSDAEESVSDDLQVTSEPTSPPNEQAQPAKQAEPPPPPPKPEEQKVQVERTIQKEEVLQKPVQVEETGKKQETPTQKPRVLEKPEEPVKRKEETPQIAEKPAKKQKTVAEDPKETTPPKSEAPIKTELSKKVENPKGTPEASKKTEPDKVVENPKETSAASKKVEPGKVVENPKGTPEASNKTEPNKVIVQNPKQLITAPKEDNPKGIKHPGEVTKAAVTRTEIVQKSETVVIKSSSTELNVATGGQQITSDIQHSGSESHIPYRIGVQVGIETPGLEIDDDMSRKYTSYSSSSAARSEGYGDTSAYSRRSASKSSYTSEGGLTPSRYGTESIASKYGTESALTSKYGTDSALGGKYGTESALTSKYGTESALTSKYGTESALGSKYGTESALGSKYGTESALGSKYGTESALSSKYSTESSLTSKYGTESALGSKYSTDSGKYGTESALGSKYGTESILTTSRVTESSKYGTDSALTSKYSAGESALTGSSKYGEITSKYGRSELDSGSKYEEYSRKSLTESSGDRDSYPSTRRAIRVEDDDGDSYVHRRSVKTTVERSGIGDEDGGSYSYSRKSVKSVTDDGGAETYVPRRKAVKSSVDEDLEIDAYVSQQKMLDEDLDPSAYLSKRRSLKSTGDNDEKESISYTQSRKIESVGEVEYKRSTSSQDEEDRLGRFKKYSRRSPENADNSESKDSGSDRQDYAFVKTVSETVHADSDSIALSMKTKKDITAPPEERPIFTKTLSGQNIERFINEQHGLHTHVPSEEAGKPYFVVQLKDTELLEDTYLRFMVKVKGEPHPDVVFLKDGKRISPTNERVRVIKDHEEVGFYELVIPDVKPSDAGLYKCVATNTYGEASSEAKLTVTESKKVFDDVPDKEGILPAGEKPDFTWKKDGKEFDPEERFKVLMGDDQDSLALIFQHVRPEDAGLYTCVAQTSTGHISCSAELTVQGTVVELHREPQKPQLIIEKREAVVNIGASAMLELQVKGYPKPAVKWTHEGKPVEPGPKYKLLYEDEESISLVIKNVEASDAGKYEVTASNELGQDIREMTLSVQAPPKFKSKLEDVSIKVDETLKMTVEVEGIPQPSVKFYKDGKEIKRSDRVQVTEKGEKHTLIIEKTTLKDSGSYSVVASNEVSQVSEFSNVNIYTKPKILKKLGEEKIVSLKEQVELSVTLESEPAPEVSWFKDGEEILGDGHYLITKDGDSYILKITGAVTTDSASYKCRAKNIYGSVDDEVRVNVRCPPRITKPLEDMTVTEQDTNVTLDVKVEAFPKPSVKWYLDEMEISEKRTEFTRVESDDGVKLVIKEVSSELSGQYSCKLVNDLGATETSAKLTVLCKPRIIKHLKDTTVEEGATLHLEVEVEGCPEPTVKWLRNGNEVSADARIKITRDIHRQESYHLAVNLIKYEEEGEYEVVVTNSLGTVNSKNYVTVQKITHSDAIEETEEPPKKLKVQVIEDEAKVQKKPEDAKPAQGFISEKVEIEEIEDDLKPRRISTQELDQNQNQEEVIFARKEIIETVENVIVESPQSIIDEEPIKKASRGRSIHFEEPTIVELDSSSPQPTPEAEELPPKRRGLSVQIEEIVETKIESQTPVETPPPVLKRSESAQVEEAVVVTERIVDEVKTPVLEDAPKKKIQRAISAQKEEVMVAESTVDAVPRKASVGRIEEEKGQKGKREGEGEIDEEVEDLLRRARSQRSRIESIKADIEDEGPEASPIILDDNMSDKSQYESLDVSFIVRGKANPPPTATWTLDGKEIKPSTKGRMVISQRGEEFRLDVKKLELGDAGVYECKLSNPVGDAQKTAKLGIIPEGEFRKPKIKEGLQNQTIAKKNTVTLKAVIIGDPVPDATWSFNGKELTADEYEQYKMIIESEDRDVEDGLKECTYSLTIPRCERENSGKFTIKAKNKWGEAESSAELTIILRPEIEGPEDVVVVPGNETKLVAIIHGYPTPSVIWTRNDNVIEPSDDIEIIEDVANEKYILRFKNVQLGDESYYKVTAKNNLGADSAEGRLRVLKEQEPTSERPRFITGLADAHVEHGEEITLMVRADGLPRPELTWYLNNKPIEDAPELKTVTGSEAQITSYLTITDFNEKDSGYYRVTAVNVVGDAETSAKISMVQTPPSFGTRLDRTMEIKEGEPLALKTKILGSPRPTAVWYKDGERIPEDDARIKTEHLPDGTVKLNIDSVLPGDSGAYKLIVKNPNGEIAALCAVAVTPTPRRPKFIKCIKDAKLTIGEPLRLAAEVTAYPPPEIKWFKDGLPVRASSNLHLEHHPDGKIALVVDSVRPENAGKYSVIVSNKLGDITGEATVTAEKRPTRPDFTTRLFPQNVVEGFPARFEVKATGYPTPKIKWTRNGAEVVPDPKHVKITELPDGTSVLVIDACDKVVDALTYKAIASNEVGDAETSAPLTVTSASKEDQPEERPLFLHAMKEVITDEGQPLKLEVSFTGNPIPSVQWTKDGQPIEPSERILLTCDGRRVGLTIDKAAPSDAGVYGVTLSNPLGTDSTEGKAIVHKVFAPPKFTQKFGDLQQLPTRDAKFIGRVSGVPQPEVKWYKGDVPLHETDKYRIKRDGDICCLYVNNSGPEDEGVYKAVATNKEGEDSCSGKLEVVKEIKTPQKIEPPSFLKRIGDTELYKGMTAKFTACATGIPEPSVQWYRNDEKLYPSDRIRMEKDTAGLLRLTIAGVDQDDIGKYSCKIFNEHGEDICHAQLRFDEVDAKPKRPIVDQYTEYDKYKKSGAPMPLSDAPIISRMTDRHLTLSWKPSIPSAPRAPVTYQLEMLELPSGDWFTVRSGIRSCVCDVRNLEPFKDYKFRIRVENKYGISDPSPFATTHRQKLEPDLPKFVPYLPPEIDFRPETSPYFPRDFDIERPPHDNMAQAPRFLRREHDTQYGMKDQNMNLFWFVYGYPKPKMTYYFNDEPIEGGGRFDTSYTRNGQATLFINKMLERDVGWYEAVAKNEHGEARQRVRLEIAELPVFLRRPDIEYVMVRGKARFEARIIGVPYPEIKWYKDWKPLATSARIKIQFIEPDTAVLVINDAILKDEGLYSVSARNVAGTVSSSAMLHVEENDLEYNTRTYKNLSPIKPKRVPFDSGYDIGDELGRGTQGITYHAVERVNGRNYAAKIMHGRGDLRPFMYNELDILNQLRHRKLISLHDAYETDNSLSLVLELAAGGELVKDYLLKQDYYTESDIAGFVRQMLQGLQYMHERGYGHMGLNIGDLLLSHPGSDELKITDFGLSRRVSLGRLYPLNYGVPEYVSPESANGEGVGLGQDMWSIGIITYILLSGKSPFRGENDRETLMKIQTGKWSFDESWWRNLSIEARDFISKLLVYQSEGRMDVHAALRHPWLERADKKWSDEFKINSSYLRDYFVLFREWYDNASCKNWFRRRPLEGAFTHPSRMVYPPGERYTPPPSLPTPERTPRKPTTWEDKIPSRSPLNYEIGVFKSESHYQYGPDTYLLQLRDVDFPVRLREYMKVAANRGPGRGYIVSDENGFDWQTPIIRERRRFTDIMDEEIDDERKARITKYGSGDTGYSIRRLRHEIGARLDTYAEAEAFLESKQEGRLPFFREKPQITAMQEGKDLELTCFAVGDPQPVVQWFKSDAIVAESHRIKIETDEEGRSHYKLTPALNFDLGTYKVVARNKIGQTVAHTRIVMGLVPDEPDSPEATQTSDTEALLTWKQPKFDGHAPVQCYSLQYKLANETEWTEQANNIDHEFYLITGLKPGESYNFRLAAKNAMGWSEQGVASAVVITKPQGAPKIQLSRAMLHLQQITDSGQEPQPDPHSKPNYALELDPVDWVSENVQDNYEFISEISRGRFSAVLKAVDKRSDTLVVAKILDLAGYEEQVEGEFAALRSLRHERIAGLIAAHKTPGSPTAVFTLEKLQGADVLTYLASRHDYTEQTVATIVTQILDGLQYLHWRGLCHLDLQPDNIVMSGVRSVQVKLVDFGSAHRVTKLGNRVPIIGHRDYISPEVLAEEPAFPLSDIWSLGVLTYVMLSGTLPFRGADETESRQNILFVRYRFENLYQEVTQEGVRFLMLVFKRHPNKRPTAEECHENRWLLPTDFMIKKRERAVFLGNRLKEYSEQYHAEKLEQVQGLSNVLTKGLLHSPSVQEELLTT